MIHWLYTREKPYPLTLDTCVNVQLRCGQIVRGRLVSDFYHGSFNSWYNDIIAYEVVK